MKISTFIMILINIILFATGQVIWKMGLQKISFSIYNLVLSPYIWAGLILYGIATLIWLKVLSVSSLSIVYPFQSIAYILGILLSVIIFGEDVPWTRWLGSVIILLGVYFISIK